MADQFYFEENNFSLMPLKPNTKIAKLKNWEGSLLTEKGYTYSAEELTPSAGVRCGVNYGKEGYLVVVDIDDDIIFKEFLAQTKMPFTLPETFTV